MSSGGKLTFTYTADRVVLSAVPYVDYTKDEQFDSDLVQTQIEKAYNTVNHLICLGQGELKDRQVIHLYTDTEGNISKKQTITGINEIAEVYDYSSAESEEELENGGIEKLEEAWDADSVKLEFDAEEKIYDIGDKIGTKDTIIGIVVEDFITKKIVSIEDNEVTIEYKVG
jgi:hypothetical protein